MELGRITYFLFILPVAVAVVELSDFYPYGSSNGDTVMAHNDDGSSGIINIAFPFPFFDQDHNSLYVNTNGAISFLTEISQFTSVAFPLEDNRRLIAIFWADVDTTNGGDVFYRETQDRDILTRVSNEIKKYFVKRRFSAKWAMVVTWLDVAHFGGSSNSLNNTFQAVIATDGVNSFSIFNYNKIEWTHGTASSGIPAQAGFNAGDGRRYFSIPNSLTPAIINITSTSNYDVPGKWIFQVDNETVQHDECSFGDGKLLLSPRSSTELGGTKVFINGPCFSPDDRIICRFNRTIQTTGIYISKYEALCVAPALYIASRLPLELSLNNGSTFNFTGIFRSSLHSSKCQNKVDLGFIMDSSGSVPFHDFQRMKVFVKRLITNFFTISSDETRISVMTFSSQVSIHIAFSRRFGFSDKNSLDSAVDNIGYIGGGTATAMALNVAYTDMFSRRNGARGTEVKKVLIILTDGRSNSGMVSVPARQLKNSGVVIFSVGIGPHVSMQELHTMASEPTDKHVIRLDNFFQLHTLAKLMSVKTCNASHFFVFCNNDVMTAVFERADLPKHVNVDHLYLRDPRCKASYNSTHVFINTPLTGCDTLYEETEQMMFFTNTLSEKSTDVSGAGVITRDYLFKAKFTCSYGRKRTVGTFSFEPARQRLAVNLRSGGNFTFTMDFYKSRFFVEPYTIYDYPVFKRLSDFIYIQYSVNTSSADLVVHAETCRATPTNRPYDNPQYIFIANGCDNDTTIQHFGYGMSSVQRFSIQAFRFLTQHRFVYIHCDLVVCNRNYLNSTCARGNICPRRYRRDVKMSSSDDSSRMYALSFGPLMFTQESDDERNTGDSDSNANYSMIGSLVGVGCLAFVLAAALVYVMMKRGQLRRVSPSPPITHVLPISEKDEASA